MKLGICDSCLDVFKIIQENVRSCRCGKSSATLKEDKRTVQVNGPIKVIGIDDATLFEAMKKQPVKGLGKEFKSFVLPKFNKSVIVIK